MTAPGGIATGAVEHLLRRATYGPTAEARRRLARLGPRAWLQEQLGAPVADDEATSARLATLATLALSPGQLLERYPPPARAGASADRAAAREAFRRSWIPLREAATARLVRAVHSPYQLREMLVEFWFNHFNVYARKGPLRWLVPAYERDVVRPRVFASFRELLGGVARSPAMLLYLDNAHSAAEPGRRVAARPRGFGARAGGRRRRGALLAPRAPGRTRPRGLNENYGRELLELHTLGVDGGYDEHDVREVARAFTGWSVERGPDGGPRFVFRPEWHDAQDKRVLGHRLPPGRGIEDGEEVLDLLASHPSTARFIARKLCRRFVAEDPSADTVAHVERAWARSGGDLRAVTAAVFTSPGFGSAAARGDKVKSPLEFLASAARVLGLAPEPGREWLELLGRLGEPLYLAAPPTGYVDDSARRAGADAVLARMRTAVALAGRVPASAESTAEAIRFWCARALGERTAAAESLAARLLEWASDLPAPPSERELVALVLGSPEFQRR